MRRGGETYYYTDYHPGNVTELRRSDGTVVNQYRYTPWGEREARTSETVGNPLQYAARHYEPAAGIYQVRARWYDPVLGRFLSEDPIGLAGGVNPYAYAANDPTNLRDPSGLIPGCESTRGKGDAFWTEGLTVSCTPTWHGELERMQREWMARSDAWRTAFGMFGDFLSGTGPAHRTFGAETRQVEELRNSRGVKAARALLCSKYNSGNSNPSVTDYGVSFGLTGPFRSGWNSTQQFVGSFNVEIHGNGNGAATFYAMNNTSMRSFLYHLPFVPSYERNAASQRARYGLGGSLPGGSMRQVYTWSETLSEACN